MAGIFEMDLSKFRGVPEGGWFFRITTYKLRHVQEVAFNGFLDPWKPHQCGYMASESFYRGGKFETMV